MLFFVMTFWKKPSASGGVAPRPLPGALPMDPTGGLLWPPDPRIIFLFHFSPVPCLYFIKYTFNIALHPSTCFKLDIMLDMIKVYSMISLWMTVVFTWGHTVTGSLKLVLSCCFKVVRNNPNVYDGWICKGDDCEQILWVWQMWIMWAFVSCC